MPSLLEPLEVIKQRSVQAPNLFCTHYVFSFFVVNSHAGWEFSISPVTVSMAWCKIVARWCPRCGHCHVRVVDVRVCVVRGDVTVGVVTIGNDVVRGCVHVGVHAVCPV